MTIELELVPTNLSIVVNTTSFVDQEEFWSLIANELSQPMDLAPRDGTWILLFVEGELPGINQGTTGRWLSAFWGNYLGPEQNQEAFGWCVPLSLTGVGYVTIQNPLCWLPGLPSPEYARGTR